MGPHHSKQERGLSSDREQDSPQETVSGQYKEAGPSGLSKESGLSAA